MIWNSKQQQTYVKKIIINLFSRGLNYSTFILVLLFAVHSSHPNTADTVSKAAFFGEEVRLGS